MDELLDQFRVEAPDLLQTTVEAVLALERDGTDAAAMDAAFRAIHTLKGSVALFDMVPLGEALHAAEDRLGDARAGRAALAAGVPDLLLSLADRTEAWLAGLGPDGAPPDGAAEACRTLAARLRAPGSPGGSVEQDAVADGGGSESGPPAWATAFLPARQGLLEGGGPRLLVRYTPDAEAFFRGDDPLALIARLPDLLALDLQPREPWPAPEFYDPFRCNLVLTAMAKTTREAAHAVLRLAGAQVEMTDARTLRETPDLAESAGAAGDPAARRLRIDPARVDALLAVVEEIAVAASALTDLRHDGGAGLDGGRRSDIDRLAGELHAGVLQLRLAPLSRTFERLPRLVRELGARLGKPVRLEIAGEGLEADRTVVDALFEPLLHLVRNALDHGIEDAGRRAAAGKPAEGHVSVRARQEGSELRLEVADDGGGVDLEAVRRAAAAQGRAVAASDGEDVFAPLFTAGVSTAARVSDVSGRGVGMDAVKQAVEALGGRIALASSPGQGTTATLWLPVSAALTRLLEVRVGEEGYGVPLALLEGVALAAAADTSAIVWRGRSAPVRRLHDLLGLAPPAPSAQLRLLVVQAAGGEPAAIAVDAFAGQSQAVLRPLIGLLAGTPGMLGWTQTADGGALFALDLAGLLA